MLESQKVNELPKQHKLMPCTHLAMRTKESNLLRNAIGRYYIDGKKQSCKKIKGLYKKLTISTALQKDGTAQNTRGSAEPGHLKKNNIQRENRTKTIPEAQRLVENLEIKSKPHCLLLCIQYN